MDGTGFAVFTRAQLISKHVVNKFYVSTKTSLDVLGGCNASCKHTSKPDKGLEELLVVGFGLKADKV